MTFHTAATLQINNLKVRSPMEIISVVLILLLIGGTWILYKKPGGEKDRITTNSTRPGVPAEKSSAFIIHKP
jgi:hypothetical protein